MHVLLWLALGLGGALALVLGLRWAMRKAAFRFMTFEVPARGRTFTYHREQFLDERGAPVTDPALLAELEEAWREIELRTAMETRI